MNRNELVDLPLYFLLGYSRFDGGLNTLGNSIELGKGKNWNRLSKSSAWLKGFEPGGCGACRGTTFIGTVRLAGCCGIGGACRGGNCGGGCDGGGGGGALWCVGTGGGAACGGGGGGGGCLTWFGADRFWFEDVNGGGGGGAGWFWIELFWVWNDVGIGGSGGGGGGGGGPLAVPFDNDAPTTFVVLTVIFLLPPLFVL